MYFLLLNGVQSGPYSLEQLKSLWKDGQATAATLYWQEGMPDWQPLGSLPNLDAGPGPARVICGFWRRLGAYSVDAILLGVAGFVLSLFFSTYFSEMGAWALLVGFTISIFYFGLLNSVVGRGQTLGKRLLRIEVTNAEGQHLTPGRSFLRYTIFALPFYLNCVLSSVGIAVVSWTALLLGLVVFCMGGTIAYLYLFNRRTRQSLHDLAVGSYVVRVQPRGLINAPPIWKGHLIAIAVLLLLAVTLACAGMALTRVAFFEQLLTVQQAILSSGSVNSVSVTEGVSMSSFNGNFQSAKVLSVNTQWKEKPLDFQAAAHEVAALVLKTDPDATRDDLLSVTISSGYNIGIYSSHRSETVSHSPAEWKSEGPDL